jgi:hypothetical protein
MLTEEFMFHHQDLKDELLLSLKELGDDEKPDAGM